MHVCMIVRKHILKNMYYTSCGSVLKDNCVKTFRYLRSATPYKGTIDKIGRISNNVCDICNAYV